MAVNDRRIFVHWSDYEATYVWSLYRSTRFRRGRNRWRWEDVTTSDSKKAERWAKHYGIPMPARPEGIDTTNVRLGKRVTWTMAVDDVDAPKQPDSP